MQNLQRSGGSAWRSDRRAHNNAGVTLIELLIVFAIIGVLVGLIVPAIQASREAARRSQCQGHLKQLGLAVAQYESATGHLPPGYLGPWPPRKVTTNGVVSERDNQLLGLLPYVLPHVEQDVLYSKIGPDMLDSRTPPSFQLWVVNADTWTAANNRIELFTCPSASQSLPSKGVLLFMNPYFDSSQSLLVLEALPLQLKFASDLGTTNYLGNAGYFYKLNNPAVDRWSGPFFTRSETRLGQFTDGTSKTLLLGEAIGAMNNSELIYAHSWMGCGAMPLAFGIGNRESWTNFNSEHPGSVGFCFADGSVRPLSINIDQKVLEAAGGFSDGDDTDIPGT
jgi:prepilin-type processing-associated H-X9-DG protein